MSQITTVGILVLAAILEVGGDALIRGGLHRSGIARLAAFLGGGLILFCYGYLVNAPPWDFGRLLGVYIVLFFVLAQLASWVVFHTPPTPAVVVAAAFIITGGVILLTAR